MSAARPWRRSSSQATRAPKRYHSRSPDDNALKIAPTSGGNDLELFTASDYQYGWHADASEIVDGDGDPRTSGVYAPDGYHAAKGFSATTALGDLDGDGRVEVVNIGWSVPNIFVWDDEGQLRPGWPQSMLDDFNWPSPLLADLDQDGMLEVVAFAAKGVSFTTSKTSGTKQCAWTSTTVMRRPPMEARRRAAPV